MWKEDTLLGKGVRARTEAAAAVADVSAHVKAGPVIDPVRRYCFCREIRRLGGIPKISAGCETRSDQHQSFPPTQHSESPRSIDASSIRHIFSDRINRMRHCES